MPELPWWKRGVVYQIAVPSFADSDGDGTGDLRGIIGKLDYLNDGTPDSLGIDAIWLSPIMPSPRRDFGYDVTDYYSIDPRFGTEQDFTDLLDACHERGMKVILDLVLNHTSDEHPWFAASRSSKDDPKRDWYVWRDGRAPGKPPNRWKAVVEGSAWKLDRKTGQYYYHGFLPFQPDLNWRNPEVKAEMFGVARHWLDKGVDGFRLDLVNFLFEDEQLRDNPLRFGTRPYLAQWHLYDFSQPESVETVKELRTLLEQYDDRAMMGEVFSDTRVDCIDYLGSGNDALHLSFYLDFVRRAWRAEEYREAVGWLEENIPPGAWPCYYLNNHDLKRTYGHLGGPLHAEAKAKVTAAMLLTLRGTPILYYGEEIGMRTSKVPRHLLDDPIAKATWPLNMGRDGSRTPMHWDPGPYAGFGAATPWLPIDPSWGRRNVERQSGDETSLLSWYRALIHLRRRHPALSGGTYAAIPDLPKGVFGYVRDAEGSRVAVLLNLTRRAKAVTEALRSIAPAWATLLSTHAAPGEPLPAAGRDLRPYEALVVEPSGR